MAEDAAAVEEEKRRKRTASADETESISQSTSPRSHHCSSSPSALARSTTPPPHQPATASTPITNLGAGLTMVASSTAAYTNMTPFDITLPMIESHDDDTVGSDVCNDAQVQFDFGSTTLPVIARDADIDVDDVCGKRVLFAPDRNGRMRLVHRPWLLSRVDRRNEELGSEHRNLLDPHFMTRSMHNMARIWVRVNRLVMRSRPETEGSEEDGTPTTISVAPSSAAVTPAATAAPKPSAPAPKSLSAKASGKETKPDTARSGTAPNAWMALAEGNVQVLWNS